VINWLRKTLHRLRSSFPNGPIDHDLDAEIATHLELAVEENVKRGMSAQEAHRQALIRFGGLEQARQQQREARGLPVLDILQQDLRYALRSLRRDRGFASVAVLILALGIGTNIAVFSVVNAILLRPLPFRDPQQLVWFSGNDGVGGLSDATYRVDAYEEFQRNNRSFQQMTAFVPYYSMSETKLMGTGEPRPVSFVWVAGNFFQTLGVRPVLGRLFTPEESVKGGRPAVVLAYPFWRRQFDGNPATVGQAIQLNNESVTVVGVLPPSFDFGAVFAPGAKMDFFRPVFMDDIRNYGHMLSVVGRLKPGVTVTQAQAEAKVLFPHLKDSGNPNWSTDIKTIITGLKDHVSGKLRRSLIVLWCAVGLILLIVCVNLSNLLLARAAARSKEFAMRSALGAGRGRLMRQLLTESLVLSGMGTLLGLGFAFATTSYLAHQGSIALPLLSEVRVDGSALAWTLLIAVLAAVLFGLAPGLKMSGRNLQEALKDSGPAMSQGKQHERLRATLVVSEVALACVLLIGAGLLLRSFLRVLDVDLGFEPEHAAALKIDYNDGGNRARRGAILQDILQRVQALPGVEAAGVADMLPLDRNRSWGLIAKGKTPSPDKNYDAFVYIVTPGYLKAMGMHLREGRDFSWRDTPTSEPVIIINQAAARREWPGEDPLGRLAQGIGYTDTRVVGVISDVRESSVEDASSPEVYVPATQGDPEGAELVVRSQVPPEVLASSVMSTLRSLNPGQPATQFRPIQEIVDRATSPRRFFVVLVATFATLGLILASLGIYGVISYSVARQTQEIGIRMALGATMGRVQLGVIGRTLQLALLGIAVGTFAALAVAKAIASLLFATAPTDPATFAGMIALLGAVALFAGYVPARRASRINPMIALRSN
jgi:putative ABC transport system permease protein